MSTRCLSQNDFSSLEYLSVIPKDLYNLIDNELIIYRFICRFASELIQTLVTLNSKYVNIDLLMSDLISLLQSYFENSPFLETISKILQDHEEVFGGAYNPYDEMIKILSRYEQTYRVDIGLDILISEIKSMLFGNDDVPYGTIKSMVIPFILDIIYHTDPNTKELIKKSFHPLVPLFVSQLNKSKDKNLSLSNLFSLNESIKFIDENKLLQIMFRHYQTLIKKFRTSDVAGLTDDFMNLGSKFADPDNLFMDYRHLRQNIETISGKLVDQGVVDFEGVKFDTTYDAIYQTFKIFVKKLIWAYYSIKLKEWHPEISISPFINVVPIFRNGKFIDYKTLEHQERK